MGGQQAWLPRGGLLLVNVVPEILIVERKAAAGGTARPRALPHPEREVQGRILRLSANLIRRQVITKPTLLSTQLCALEIRIRDCKSCLVTIERPYHDARGLGHLITAQSILLMNNYELNMNRLHAKTDDGNMFNTID